MFVCVCLFIIIFFAQSVSNKNGYSGPESVSFEKPLTSVAVFPLRDLTRAFMESSFIGIRDDAEPEIYRASSRDGPINLK